MGARYPVPKSYRSAPRSPSAPHFPTGPEVPKIPANDNIPRPANDNFPKPSRMPNGLKGLPLRTAFRFAGIVGTGLIIYDWYKTAERFSARGNDEWGSPLCNSQSLIQNTCGGWQGPVWQHTFLGCSLTTSCASGNITGLPQNGTGNGDKIGYFLYRQITSTSWRTKCVISYAKNGKTSWNRLPHEYPLLSAWPRPEVPLINPMLDPEAIPIDAPYEVPPALPYRALPEQKPNPWRHPNYQPRRGPNIRPSPRWRPRHRTDGKPNVWEWPATDPWSGPTIVANIGSSGATPPPAPNGRPARGRPPGNRFIPKHRRRNRSDEGGKATPGKGQLGPVLGAVNAVSEANDLLDALWRALPKARKTMVKGKATTPQQKFYDLRAFLQHNDDLMNPHSMDRFWDRAFQNVVDNQIEDAVFGAIGSASGAASAKNPYFPKFRGYQTGPAH